MSDEFEQLMRDLPTRPPSEAMDARVLGAIDAARRDRMKIAVSWGALSAAAAIALAFFLGPASPTTQTSSSTLASGSRTSKPASQGGLAISTPTSIATTTADNAQSPIVIARVVQQYIDTGVTRTYSDGQTPVRVYTRKTIRQEYWIDPETNASIERTTPSEETVLVQQAMY